MTPAEARALTDRDLDAAIGRLLGLRVNREDGGFYWVGNGPGNPRSKLEHYSTDGNAMLRLAEEMEKRELFLIVERDRVYFGDFEFEAVREPIPLDGITNLPRAVAEAVLVAAGGGA